MSGKGNSEEEASPSSATLTAKNGNPGGSGSSKVRITSTVVPTAASSSSPRKPSNELGESANPLEASSTSFTGSSTSYGRPTPSVLNGDNSDARSEARSEESGTTALTVRNPGGGGNDVESEIEMEDQGKLEKEAQRRKVLSFSVMAAATLVAIIAGVLTGVIVYLFSKSSLEQAAVEKGEAVILGATAQIRTQQGKMISLVDELGDFVLSTSYAHNYSDPFGTTQFINDTVFDSWIARQQVASAVYGWGIRALYPSFRYTMPEQNKTEQLRDGCHDLCTRPGDPEYTHLAGVSVWYDTLLDGSRDYTYTTTQPAGIRGDTFRLNRRDNYSNSRVIGEKLYDYNQMGINGNGSFTSGSWQPPYLWATLDGNTYFYLTYNKLVREPRSGVSIAVIAWDVLPNWFAALTSILPISDKELLVLTARDWSVLAFSGDPLGDKRLRNCSQDFASGETNARCTDLKAFTHDHWFVREIANSYTQFVESAAPEAHNSWETLRGSPQSARYLLMTLEVWNQDRLRVVATYGVHSDEALGSLAANTTTTIALASIVILISSLCLAAIGTIALHHTHKTVDLASMLAARVACYDTDGAEKVLAEHSSGNALLNDYFGRIVRNLKAYRPFLPRSLMTSGNDHSSSAPGDSSNQDGEKEAPVEFPSPPGDDDDTSSMDAGEIGNTTNNVVQLSRLTQHRFKSIRGTVMIIDWANLNTSDIKITTRHIRAFCSLALPIIHQSGGVVDILLPTRMQVTYNYHNSVVKHEEAACRCANRVRSKLSEDPRGKTFNVAIAIATGFNMVGTCGNDDQLARVVIGEAVDLANRLPSLQRLIGCPVVITETTFVGCPFLAVAVDHIRPQWLQAGRTKLVSIFELTSTVGNGRSHVMYSIFSKLKLRQTSDAVLEFREAFAANKEDPQLKRLESVFQGVGSWAAHGYCRMERGWDRLEGDGFDSSSVFSTSFAASQSRSTVPLDASLGEPIAQDAANAKAKLTEVRAEQSKGMADVVEQDGGNMLFSIFVPAAAEEDENTMPAKKEGLETRFVDVTGETWERGLSLGKGQFGEVFVVVSSFGSLGAGKVFDLLKDKDGFDVESLVNEVKILSQYRHEHIAGYISCCITDDTFLIIMEYLSAGSLREILGQIGKIPINAVYRYMADILRGLAYLHEQGIVHCDIKPDNVLLMGDGTCKLADFGTAKLLTQGGDAAGVVRGTPRYMSPEGAMGVWEASADIYSIGILILELLTGQNPWYKFQGNDTAFLMQLSRNVPDMQPAIPDDISPDLKNIVQQCLLRDAELRPTADQLLVMMQ